jgi:hypothetical protein
VIAPADLVGLALENLHPQLDAFIINGRDDLPGSLLLIMIGDRAVHIVSPHMSIVYLAHDVLMRAPLRLFNTIDGQLPWFIPADVEPTVPSPTTAWSMSRFRTRTSRPIGPTRAARSSSSAPASG